MLLTPQTQALEKQAQKLQIRKKLALNGGKKTFEQAHRKAFLSVDQPGFFTPAERVELISSMLEAATFDQMALAAALTLSGMETKRLSTHERGLLDALRQLELLHDVSPLHSSERYATWRVGRLFRHPFRLFTHSLVDLDELVNYFGIEVSWYFAWTSHYTKWLVFPAIFGLVVWCIRPDDRSIDEDATAPLFAFATAAWAGLMCSSWERKQSELVYEWGVTPNSSTSVLNKDVRPNFVGEWRASQVTGEMELAHSRDSNRLGVFTISVLTTLGSLLVPLAFMIFSLNLQGYIQPETGRILGLLPVYLPSLAVYAQVGSVFDPNGPLAMLPVALHAISISLLNHGFRSIARALTDFENHRTKTEWRNSFALKRFCFEACDCYLSLFYLAFEARDLPRLRIELMSLFSVDCLRRVSFESILPFVAQRVSRASSGENLNVHSAANAEDSASNQMRLEEYDDFDDWLEMTIQFGYITLFAAAFPLAGLIAVCCNSIELYIDLWKLSHVYRRPTISRTDSIGIWQNLLFIIAVCSIFTNLGLMSCSSGQLASLAPSFFEQVPPRGGDHSKGLIGFMQGVNHDIRMGKGNGRWSHDARASTGRRRAHTTTTPRMVKGRGRHLVLILVAAEHVLLLVLWVGKRVLAAPPQWVQLARAREEHDARASVESSESSSTDARPVMHTSLLPKVDAGVGRGLGVSREEPQWSWLEL